FSVQRTDTQNYTNTFDQEQFIINKAAGSVFTYLNNSRANITIEQYNVIYLNATLETGAGTIKLYNNGTLINQGISPLSNLTNFTTIGLFNITTQYDGNVNYTSAFETWYVNVTELDVTPPQISILHPQNNSYSSVRTQLNYTASDNFALDKCWYSINLGATNTTITCGQNISGLDSGQGSSTWRVYANDTRGNQNSSSVTFLVDSINPAIQFDSPTETNGTTLGRNFIQVNATASDTNLANITIKLYNSAGSQIRSNVSTNPFFINYTGLNEGNYSFNATANDSDGNTGNTETRSVSLARPSLTILRPENETYFNNISLLLNFSASLEDSVKYNLDNTANTTITGNTTFNTTTGPHTLYLFANNTVGTTTKNVTFTINISKFKVIYSNYKNNGSTTDFNQSSYEDIQNLSGVVLERTSHGKISFNQAINLTNDSNPGDNILDLDSYTNISQNHIEINTTAVPNLNKSATLYLYGLTLSDPRVLRDGSVCPSTICTEVSYSGGTFIFNVTQFTNYSAEETPGAAETPPSGGGEASVGGGVKQCVNKGDCKEDQECVDGLCVKLFDIKIIDFESPARLGEFFEFTYFIKAVAEINNDVVISFWIEKGGEKISSGSDTIYLGKFDEKTEASKIFLPSSFESGVYSFVIEVSYEGYYARSQRTIEVQVKGGQITITPVDTDRIKTFVIAFLVLLAIVALALIVYRERKKIKRNIEFGFAQEARFFGRHKTSILAFFLISVAGLLLYLFGFYEFLALKISEATLWFRIYSLYVYYALLGLILIIILVSILKSRKAKEKFHEFHEWGKRRSIEKFFERKYSRGVREAEKLERGAEIIGEGLTKEVKAIGKEIKVIGRKLGGEIEKEERKIPKITAGMSKDKGTVEREIPKVASELYKGFKAVGREAHKITSEMSKGAESVGEEISEEAVKAGEGFAKGIRKLERGLKADEKTKKIGEKNYRVVKVSRRSGPSFFSAVGDRIKKASKKIGGTAGLLSKAFGKRTRKIIIGDFERHFTKDNEKIARKNKETVRNITRLKEAFDKKRIERKEKEAKAKKKEYK
ncbi:MAG: hypothetical protein AABX79_01845, partial [Nanoarchaeota archaeon]